MHRLTLLRRYKELFGNVSQTCRYYGISRPTFHEWLRRYEGKGIKG